MTLLALFWLCFSEILTLADPAPQYTQSYSIFIRGELIGNETVTESIDKDGSRVCRSQHEMLVSDGLETKRMAYETTMVFAKDSQAPTKYSFRYLSGSSKDFCEVTVQSGRITRVLSRSGKLSETSSLYQPGTVILDFNVFYQYDLLSRLYDFKKGGRQVFNNFIPVVGSELPLAVTWLEDAKLEHAKGSIPVRNFKIEFVGVRSGNFSTDMNGRLVRLIMREQDLEVVRKDLVPDK